MFWEMRDTPVLMVLIFYGSDITFLYIFFVAEIYDSYAFDISNCEEA